MFIESLLGCSAIHEISNWIPMSRWSNVRHRGNLIASMIFQVYFVWKASRLLYLEHQNGVTESLQEQTLQQLYAVGGYFVYDLCYLIQTTPFSGYVLHHLVGLGMLSILCSLGPPRSELVSSYNQLCLVTEITNPIITLRHFTRGSAFERTQKWLMFFTYTVFRIILYPILSYRLHLRIQQPRLFNLFIGIYAMSLVWYRRILQMLSK